MTEIPARQAASHQTPDLSVILVLNDNAPSRWRAEWIFELKMGGRRVAHLAVYPPN